MQVETKRRIIFGAVFMAVMFVISVAIYAYCGLENVGKVRLFNIGYNMIALLASMVLYYCCLVDGTEQNAVRRAFMYAIVANFTGMDIDSVSYALDATPALRSLNVFLTPWIYIFDCIIAYYILKYLVTSLNLIEETIVQRLLKCAFVGAVIGSAVSLTNYFVPLYYHVDEKGEFIYEDFHFACYIYPVLVCILIIAGVIGYRKRLEIKQVAAALLYSILTIGLIIASETVAMFYINYAVTFLILLFMYILLNIEKGNQSLVVGKEIDAARKIQSGILPRLKPDYDNIPEFDLYAEMIPAKEVGGNFYDFFMMEGRYLGLVIGNVAGKGVGTALFMAAAKTMLHMRAQLGGTPEEALKKVNRQIIETNEECMEVGIWLGIVDLVTGHLEYANAGHNNAVMLCNAKGESFTLDVIEADPPLGRDVESTYRRYETELRPGDSIFLFDGLWELEKDGASIPGILNENKGLSNEEVCTRVHEALIKSLYGRAQSEDVAMLKFTLKQLKSEVMQ